MEGPTDIYGQGRNTQKSSGYAPHPYFPAVFNTHNCIDKEMHGRKRRIVSQGFSTATIKSSEPMIIHHVQNLCNALMKSIPKLQGLSDDEWSPTQDMAAWSESESSVAQIDQPLIELQSQLSNPRRHLRPNIRPAIQPHHIPQATLACQCYCERQPPYLPTLCFPGALQCQAQRLVQSRQMDIPRDGS